MYDINTRERAVALAAQGRSLNSVSRETGISRYAIRSWQTRIEPVERVGKPCPRCQEQGCAAVTSTSKHWPCLFPQHGPGKKHERPIVLEAWQRAIVDAHPWEFIRGLIHSDGCLITNWTTRLVAGERKRYEYPRYFFTNKSDDIRGLYTDTLDKLSVEWTHCTRDGNPYNISVAKKASIVLLDAHVGPKH
ncbi:MULTISPECIES: helix-turn-helix domain-containing protein [Streptomyces]|uniref:Helix-turn-helix domain-containing protein n=1 Tax=Streptomyces canarius TaxID=285453 RepID=A0ABQ3CHP2_9ACTN|nr:helix-turn-helix domain-containing protein [Streptomyces canarius]GHA12562.1 hypothetical protein GCM10010345_16480 [Streptomyces canarius]